MFLKSSWLPARIPFTLLTLPLFWFVLSISPNLHHWRSLWVLFIVHGLLYGAVHVYINFYESGVRQINGFTVTRNPSETKLNIAIAIHSLATLLGFLFVNLAFAGFVLFYGLIAYASGLSGFSSKPNFLALLFIRVVQGFVATLLYYIGLNDLPIENALHAKVLIPAVVSTLVLIAFFPPRQQASEIQKLKQVFYQRIDLLIISAGLSVWYFSTYISPGYTAGVVGAFGIGILLLIHQYYMTTRKGALSSNVTWIHWLSSFILNGYTFYVFTDYTQIFQLVN